MNPNIVKGPHTCQTTRQNGCSTRRINARSRQARGHLAFQQSTAVVLGRKESQGSLQTTTLSPSLTLHIGSDRPAPFHPSYIFSILLSYLPLAERSQHLANAQSKHTASQEHRAFHSHTEAALVFRDLNSRKRTNTDAEKVAGSRADREP